MNSRVHYLPLLLLLLACRQPPAQTPESAYRAFAKSIEKGQFQQAYQSLSAQTRALLEERAGAVSKSSGGAVKDEPALLAFVTAQKPAPLSEVKLLGLDGGTALLAATAGENTQNIELVHEDGGWKVDLSGRLKQ